MNAEKSHLSYETKEVEEKLPFFSIVIPAHNEEGYIAELLDLILAEGVDCEILVSNSACTDSTPEIVEDYSRRYPVKIRLVPSTKGVSNARNDGVKAARSDDYIFFLDADTRFKKGFLRKALQKMIKKKLDVAGFNLKADNDDIINNAIMRTLSLKQRISAQIGENMFTGAALLVRKKWHEKAGGFPDKPFFEDPLYTQKIGKLGGKCGIIDETAIFNTERFGKTSSEKIGYVAKFIKAYVHEVLTGRTDPAMVLEYKKNRRKHK